MNTSSNLLQQRQLRRYNPFPMVAINKQIKELETPLKDEGFDSLIVKKITFSQRLHDLFDSFYFAIEINVSF